MKIRDIEGNELKVGDTVYYARIQWELSELVKVKITSIDLEQNIVRMGKYTSKRPDSQLIKKK